MSPTSEMDLFPLRPSDLTAFRQELMPLSTTTDYRLKPPLQMDVAYPRYEGLGKPVRTVISNPSPDDWLILLLGPIQWLR